MKTTKKFKLGPIQRKWLRALKSGKYKQGKTQLCAVGPRGGKRHCCLGVLCDVMKIKSKLIGGEALEYDGEEGVLPDSVQRKIKLRDDNGGIVGGGSLADLNDSAYTKSYAPIIKIIEKTPELIFTKPA